MPDNQHRGIPIVTTGTVSGVARELGIRPWQETRPNVPLMAWLQMTSLAERETYEKYGPKPEVQFLAKPMPDGSYANEDIFFRMVYKPWVTVFALIPGHNGETYVPVTLEWKQGNRLITIVPVSGVPGKKEAGVSDEVGKMLATADREFEEETGFRTISVMPTGIKSGHYDQVRGTELKFFTAVATLPDPLPTQKPTKLDDNEYLKLVLFELGDWLEFLEEGHLEEGFGVESCAVAATFFGLRHLGRLKLT